MVTFFKTSLLFSLVILFTSTTFSFGEVGIGDVSVTAEIDLYKAYEGQQLQGTVSVTHKVNSKIDDSSFHLEDAPLKVEPIKKVNFSAGANLEMSIYHFVLPAKPQGLYVLPSISVKVDGKTIKSIPSSYEVKPLVTNYYSPSYSYTPSYTPNSNTSGSPQLPPNLPPVIRPIQNPATLELKTSIDGLNPIYPGQTAWFTYRFIYNGNIALSKEQLPLLDASGFEKIGDKRTREYEDSGLSVTEVAQQVKALKPGTYVFPKSFIEGYAYVDNALGERTNLEPKLHSETAPISIEVLDFPPGRPATFNGAIGQFTIETTLLTPPVAAPDEDMKLAIDIAGTGELGPIQMPDLSKAGFKQLFRLSDLPTLGEITGNTKRFIVTLEPLSTSVKNIPSIPFSYFDPLAGVYNTVSSNPIPITVKEIQQPSSPPAAIQPQAQPTEVVPSTSTPQTNIPEQIQTYTPKAVPIEGNINMSTSDLHNILFGTWNTLWIIPLGAAFLFFLVGLKKYLNELKSRIPTKTSRDYFEAALNSSTDAPTFYNNLNSAFLLRLKEKGYIANQNVMPEKLPDSGIEGEVRAFLYSIEEQRFTGKKLDSNEVVKQAKELFAKI